MTNRQKILGSVSAIALLSIAGMGVSSAAPILTVNVPADTLNGVGPLTTASFNNQLQSAGSVTANTSFVHIGDPTLPGITAFYGYGTGNALTVSSNDIFADATGNLTPLTSLDFFTVDGTVNTTGLAASLQIVDGTAITASINGSTVNVDATNLGPDTANLGNSIDVNSNALHATGLGNEATVVVDGNINPSLVSAVAGDATLSFGTATITADATALASSTQVGLGGADYTPASPTRALVLWRRSSLVGRTRLVCSRMSRSM